MTPAAYLALGGALCYFIGIAGFQSWDPLRYVGIAGIAAIVLGVAWGILEVIDDQDHS